MNLNRLKTSVIISLFLTTNLAAFTPANAELNTSATEHWAKPIVENLQKEKLFLALETDAVSLNKPITDKEFQNLLSELWLSETVTLPISDGTPITDVKETKLTRQGAAEYIYSAFKPFLDTNESDAIKWTISANIMNGYPDGQFKPEKSLTLAQGVAVMKNTKDFLANHPDLLYKISHNGSQENRDVTYSFQANPNGKSDFILSWGKKSTGGYVITITDIKIENKSIIVSYKTKSPNSEDMVIQAITYPKDTKTIDIPFENFKQYTVTLQEMK